MKKSDALSLIVAVIILVGGYLLLSGRSESPESSYSNDDPKSIHYFCLDGSIDALYKESSVVLSLSDKRIMDLPQVPSASGTRYEQGVISFVSKGDNAFLEENKEITYKDCVVNSGSAVTSGKSFFTDKGKTFSLSYPKDFLIADTNIEGTKLWRLNADRSGTIFVKLTLPKSSQPQTNFSEAVFTVGASTDSRATETCLSAKNGEKYGVGAKSINGSLYAKITSEDAGAGNFYETTSYRTIRNNQCYVIEYTIHSTNIGAYSEDQGVKEFDKQKVVNALESIVSSVNFLKGAVELDSSIKGSIEGKSVTAISLVEDSRCHAGVQCIWAGTVRVKVLVVNGATSKEDTITLSQSKNIAGLTVTLVSVSPEATDKKLNFSDYKFEFSMK